MRKRTISLYVNSSAHQVEIGPRTTLLEVLRDELHLTGTKNGCGQGHCGACTVIVDGKAVRSCIYKASRADGVRVETIEGLAENGELHPLQRAFIEHGAVQCGFCTPGMIMAAKALLDANPQPTDEEIKDALQCNLCRCTGYTRIIQAIRGAAEGTPPQIPTAESPLTAVGRPVPRPDARAKVTGQATFAADLYFEGMLHARVLRSKYPHARPLQVDASRAKALPGVVAVLTAEDVPGAKNHGLVRPDWPVLAYDKVRYVGDAIALVAAETAEIAEQALELIQVEYEPLPVVTSPQQALAPDAPLVHDGGNLLKHIQVRKGDAEKGFAEADVIVEREYHTPSLDHAFLEPEAGVAAVDVEGRITVYVGSQIPFDDRRQIAASLAIPEEKVRVKATQVGGAFGGKEDISVQIHLALLAQATGRPVKLVFTRQESLFVHPKRHATTIRLKTGATRDGRLTAVQAEIYGDAGAYASLSEHVMTRTATHAAGPYDVPNVKVDCYAAYTNNVPAGAFRGFGVPQAAFAMESQMDILAEELGLSPFDIRRKNALRVGSTTATGQVLRESVGLLETIDRVEKEITSNVKRETSNVKRETSNVKRETSTIENRKPVLSEAEGSKIENRMAWGVACAYKNVGLGGGAPDCAGAEVELTGDGRAIVRAGAAEVGQGLVGVLALVAAEELGLPYDWVEVLVADTDQTLDGGATTASRQSFITGNAVRLAAQRVREAVAQAASEELGAPPDRLVFKNGRVHAFCYKTGWGRPSAANGGKESISLAQAVALAKGEGREVRASVVYQPPKTVPLGEVGDMHFAFGYATQAALVEVDTNTGQVEVLKVIAAHDVGRALNPLAVAGQIEGGVVMGIGIALQEEFVMEEGIPKTTSLARYRIPSIERTPQIVPIIVEDRAPEGPYGAKGIGEIPSIPTAPAIVNAIYNATGVRIYSLPATPKKILGLGTRDKGSGGPSP
ncbi:MAG: 2Fe-2S iron-sulfur cluster binding domain-containing protein [Chloroflexi bacterium]|nr:2Fe-2S iron-sulfur cluster binding domain-containing protein [Chloroflexota bacterium]